VDYGIIVEKVRGLNDKVAAIFGLELFSNGKMCELGPWLMDRGSGRFTMDQGHGHGGELTRASIPGRFQPWGPDMRWGKGRGLYGYSILHITEAWEVARGWRTSGGALAQNGDGVGVVGDRRRRVVGVESFTGVRVAFYRAKVRGGAVVPSMASVEGASMLPGLKAPVPREMKREGAA
jgi:hypothetical protein